MADEIDKANDQAMELLESQIESARMAAAVIVQGIGSCLWCGEELDDDRRWCDAEHRDEYQHFMQRKTRG